MGILVFDNPARVVSGSLWKNAHWRSLAQVFLCMILVFYRNDNGTTCDVLNQPVCNRHLKYSC